MRLLASLLVGTAVACLGGCQSIRGSQRFVSAADISRSSKFGCPSDNDLATKPVAPETAGEYRNRIVRKCLKAIDLNYQEFTTGLHKESVTSRLLVDILVQGFTAGASIASEKTAHRLAAAGGFVAGTGAAINKDVYYDQTLPALEAIMAARRIKVLTTVLSAERNDPEAKSYTLEIAAGDLSDYQAAGNVYLAIGDLTKAATDRAATEQDKLDFVKGTLDLGVGAPLDPGLVSRQNKVLVAIDSLDKTTATQIAGDLKIPVDGMPLPQVTDLIRNVVASRLYHGTAAEQGSALSALEAIFTNRGALK